MRFYVNVLTRLLLLGCVIPLTISTMVYEGFTTNYTRYVFSQRGFESQYNEGIYKYRVLGKALLLKTYRVIKHYEIPTIKPQFLSLLDENADRKFYSAYFYMNTIFLCLTSIMLFFVLGGQKNLNFITVDLPIISMCFLMGITQYVVVPYDTLSYFFLALAAFFIISSRQTLWNTMALCFVVVSATLTRETSALILALYFAMNYRTILAKPTSLMINQTQRDFFLITICYISTYVGLRYVLGGANVIYQDLRILENINPLSLLSIIFFGSFAILVSITESASKSVLVLYIVSLPYIISIVLIANPWEIRLWIPIILLVLILKVKAAQAHEITEQGVSKQHAA